MRQLILLLILAVAATGCANRAQSGAGLGALTGATIGALTSKNKMSGAAIGAGIGMAAGYIIGNEMDKNDRQHISSTLEHTPSGEVTEWRNPDTGVQYHARPKPPRRREGRIYREVELKADMPNGKTETVYADAYRGPDGRWHLVQ